MEKILISACLLGDNTKYDGGNNYFPLVEKLKKKYQLVPFCPEVECGLPIPREPAEIKSSKVITKSGKDVTSLYNSSAEKAVNLCKFLGIHIAILKDGSPACGCRYIHDGTFSGLKIEGLGVTARALINAGVKVYAETDGLDFLLPNIGKEKATLKKNLEKQKAKADLKSKKKEPREEGSFEDKPRKSYRKRPEGVTSRDDKNEFGHFERKKSFGDKKPFGRKPAGRKSYGEKKSYGDKPYGERKSYSGKKSFGDKKTYGEKKSYGERKSYGDKKSYGAKKSYGERKSYSGSKKSFGGNKSGRSFGKRSYGNKKD